MIKYFCDRCGDEVYKYTKLFEVTVKSPVDGSGFAIDEVKTGIYILCCDCVKELNKFMAIKGRNYE